MGIVKKKLALALARSVESVLYASYDVYLKNGGDANLSRDQFMAQVRDVLAGKEEER